MKNWAPPPPPPVAQREPATCRRELIRVGRACLWSYFSVLASGAGSAAGAGPFWLLGLASSLAAGPWAKGAGLGPELAWLWGRLEG